MNALIYDDTRRAWLRFGRPRSVIAADSLADVRPALRQIDAEVGRRGLWAAGFVSYEAAPAFDAALAVAPADDFPLLCFGLFDAPEVVAAPGGGADPAAPAPGWSAAISEDGYRDSIARIRRHIAAGDIYQVNRTLRLTAPWTDPMALFLRLSAAQPTAYRALVDVGRWCVGSVSPELFFDWQDGRIVSRPMKGTRPRGRWPDEDRSLAQALRNSEKDRAENVMIVDMVRNDLGRIARPGSVRVERLFEIEAYPTVWQMTGSVSCASAAAGVEPIFEALFPAASITGAPKCAAMEIIAREEGAPRGVYTGAVGFVAPQRRARFNVAIRTFVADRERRTLAYGTGGGIVWDSDAAEEWAECADKTRVLAQAPFTAPLRETLRWERAGGYAALGQHLARLRVSAERFGYRCDPAAVRAQLAAAAAGWQDATPRLVRLTLSPAGACEIAAAPLAPLPSPYRLGLAATPVDERDLLLYHKTARRERYAAALATRPDCDDVLLWNGRGEVTESCIANLLFERDGAWWTPPLRCGLLPGLQRAALLASGEVREGVLRIEEIEAAGSLHLANAVRGRWEAHWTPARPRAGRATAARD